MMFSFKARLGIALALLVCSSACSRPQGSNNASKKDTAAAPLVPDIRVPDSQGKVVQGYITTLSDAETQESASRALIAIGPPAIDPLIELLRTTPSSSVRDAAAQTLAEFEDERVDQALTEAIQKGGLRVTLVAYRFLIRKGQPGSERSLVDALNAYGKLAMAEDFMACGNPTLEKAAEEWISKTGHTKTGRTSTAEIITWGETGSPLKPTLVFHFDGDLASTAGDKPAESNDVSFVPGKWGSAVSVDLKGVLKYALSDKLDFRDGTIEMWVSPRFTGNDPEFAKLNHPLLLYHTPSDQFVFSQSTFGGFYAGSVVNGAFKGAGGGAIGRWKPGEWHHVAFTYSSKPLRQRLYVDGALTSEVTGPMPPPKRSTGTFTIGCDDYGVAAGFVVDEVLIYKSEKSRRSVTADFTRRSPFEDP